MFAQPKFVAVLAISLFLSACAPFEPSSYPAPQQGPRTSYPESSKPAPAPKPEAPSHEITPVKAETTANNDAVNSLIDQAWQLHNDGAYDRSNAVAERAQRLSSSTAEVYLVMASNYFALAELSLAKQIAKQGLPFSQNNWAVERRLKNLLQRISQAGG